jgi:beta-mannosidase
MSHAASITQLPGPWSLCAQPANAIQHPAQLDAGQPQWLPAQVPGTVASSLAAVGAWNLDQPLDADAHDWWYRTAFPAPTTPGHLCFAGLATLTEVWLNGKLVLTSDNMFRTYRIDIGTHIQPQNDLVLVFRSLKHACAEKRPRPRWKTNLVDLQQLRWRRTTLLGRMPGWSPPAPPVGPWREIRLESNPALDLRLRSTLEDGVGVVRLTTRLATTHASEDVVLHVGRHSIRAERQGDSWCATLRIPNPPLWWPHTHGPQPLLDASLVIGAGETHTIPCGQVGFRTITTPADRFAIHVNGESIYCRGACWTVSDIVTLDGDPETLLRDLTLARDAGVNMLRIGGTMIYESDRFYRLCDELGIMVWQDFMFANLDYPVDDASFAANIEAEALEQIARLAPHPCIAVYCGNSEIEQQAAMLGVPETLWRNRWFAERLPALCAEHHPGIPYVPSSPSGGALPFHVRDGVAHYYGVGAYRRSSADVRKDDVAFASECLGFANVPEPATLRALGDVPAVHHPRWKERVPRDAGAAWDFEDVRDFYFKQLFGVDPTQMRWCDPERYLKLSRVVPGEMMTRVFAEWRSTHTRNAGGLVWFFKDLWPGAGWGVVDSEGTPKAPYYALKRSWSTRQLTITDEGLDGLHLHAANETPHPFHGFVELVLLKEGHIVIARQAVACTLAPRSQTRWSADALLKAFYDVAYAYRFGPPSYDVAIATLLDERQQMVSEAYHMPLAREPQGLPSVNISATALASDNGLDLTLTSDRFLHYVTLDIKGFVPDDQYFHVSPVRPRTVRLLGTGAKASGYVEALNLQYPVKL